MKIAYFIHCYPPAKGGLEYLSGEIVDILRKAGHEVHVFTGKGETLDSYKTFDNWVDESQDTDYIHRLPLRFFWQRLANKFLNKLIFVTGFFSPWYFGPILEYSQQDKEVIADCDLVFGAGMPTKMFYDSYRFAKKYKKRLIVLPAYHPVSYYKRSYYFQKVLSSAKKIINLSEYEKSNLLKEYKIDISKLKLLIYSPFSQKDVDQIELHNKNRINRIKSEKLTIGFIGQITTRKNLEFIAHTSKHLSGKDHRILLAGQKTNSSGMVEEMFKSLKNVNIVFNFSDKQKKDLYSQIDIFISPSDEESYGIATLEAMMHGCLVMSRFSLIDSSKFPLIVSTPDKAASIIKDLDEMKWKSQLELQAKIALKLTRENFKETLKNIIES